MYLASRPSSALATALSGLAASARAAATHPLKRGAKLLLAEPWRLELIIPGAAEADPDEIERIIRTQKEVMRDLGRRRHHAYDSNRMLALRQAYIAVRLARLRERAARRQLPVLSAGPMRLVAPMARHHAGPGDRIPSRGSQAILDLSDDRDFVALLEGRDQLHQEISRAKARLVDIDARILRKLGRAERALAAKWRITRETYVRAAYVVEASLVQRLRISRSSAGAVEAEMRP